MHPTLPEFPDAAALQFFQKDEKTPARKCFHKSLPEYNSLQIVRGWKWLCHAEKFHLLLPRIWQCGVQFSQRKCPRCFPCKNCIHDWRNWQCQPLKAPHIGCVNTWRFCECLRRFDIVISGSCAILHRLFFYRMAMISMKQLEIKSMRCCVYG